MFPFSTEIGGGQTIRALFENVNIETNIIHINKQANNILAGFS